jgi:hypothetical protein
MGTVTSIDCKHKRDGSDLLINCKFTTGTVAGSVGYFSIPSGLSIKSGTPRFASAAIVAHDSALAGARLAYVDIANVNNSSVVFGYHTSGGFAQSTFNGGYSSSTNTSVLIRLPIEGWNTPNQVIATVKDVLTTPNFPNGKPRFYSAFISSTGVVSREKGDFINGNCTNSSPMICTLNSGFTDLNCVGSPWNSTVAGRITSYGNTVIDIQYSGNPQLDTTIFCHGY